MPTRGARASAIAILGALLVFGSPIASAADTATATPARAAPGELLALVYTLDATALASVDVAQSVRCVLATPAGELDCGAVAALADARVQGGARSFAFELVAPSAEGTYEVRFTRTATASVTAPPSTAPVGATATFEVASPPALDPASLQESTIEAPSQATTSTGGGAWLASVFMASGATAAAVTVVRKGGRA